MSMESKQNKKIGILNKGKNNTFIDNSFEGLDVGIQDEGDGTLASGNKFRDGELLQEEQEKWNTGNLPDGYPIRCDTNQIKKTVQDLSDEYYQKTQAGKFNKVWEKVIRNLIESGRKELERREMKNRNTSWFSMNNPIIYILVIVILAGITYIWGI
jgi:hypothetical protein